MRKAASALQRSVLVWVIVAAGLLPACSNSGSTSAGSGGVIGSGGVSPIDGTGGSSPTTTPGRGGDVGTGSGGTIGTGGQGTGGAAGGSQPGSGGSAGVSQPDGGGLASGGVTATGGRIGSGGRSGGGSTGTQGTGGTTAPIDGGATGLGGDAGGRTSTTVGAGGSGAGGSATGGGNGSSGAVPSAGCGKTPPASGRATISVSGTSREYILKVPDGYDPNHPYRLIFGFHGAQYDANWVATGKPTSGTGVTLSGPWFGIESEANGSAIFVAPEKASGSQDVAFVDAMVAQFKSQLCIDESRIFAVGFSMGAMMTITLGCNRSDVFRGIGPMSGQISGSCPTGNHIAYWASHGTNDPTINIKQGEAARDAFVTRNHCSSQTSSPDENNCVTYQGCDAGYPVVWCTFDGVHEPPSFSGPEIWKFLAPL
jgi:polyhydroxybutyrate depolymerase